MKLIKKSSSRCIQSSGNLLNFLKPNGLFFLFLFIFLFLKMSELPASGEVDYFKEMGVVRPDKTTYAPNFVLPDINGNKIGLSGFQGKFVMLNFWATW